MIKFLKHQKKEAGYAYKFLRTAIIPLACLLVFLSCDRKKSAEKTGPYTDRVITIVDGDTFVLKSGKTVRIAMIDTPETGEPFYEEASLHLAQLILGKEVTLKAVGSGIDRYKRILAEVFIDTINVARSMLGDGLAMLYLFRDNAYLKDKYLPYQKAAMVKKIGIWSLPEPVKEGYYLYLKGSYRFHRPLCFHLKHADPEKLVRLESRTEALSKGFSPCRSCRP